MTNGVPPITIMLVGLTKTGKSTSWIQAFGSKALCIATEAHAIAPAFDPELNPLRDARGTPITEKHAAPPKVVYCMSTTNPADEVLRAIREQVVPGVAKGEIGAVILDTVTTLADREFAWIKQTMKAWDSYGRGSKRLYDRIQTLLSELLALGVVVVGVAHESEPSSFTDNATGKSTFRPGGPKLPGDLVKSSPSLFGTILRCTVRADDDGNPRRVFVCNPLDTQWVTGDSWNVVGAVEPMDLRSVATRIWKKARELHA